MGLGDLGVGEGGGEGNLDAGDDVNASKDSVKTNDSTVTVGQAEQSIQGTTRQGLGILEDEVGGGEVKYENTGVAFATNIGPVDAVVTASKKKVILSMIRF